MASVEAIADFITTLRVHFNVPIAMTDPARSEKERAWTVSISQCIAPYEDSVVKRAADQILNTWTSSDRRFPLPGKIREICNDIATEDRRKPLLQKAIDEAHDGHKAPRASRARTQLVLDLLRGDLGQRAAREMWIGTLVDYVRENVQLPPDNLIPTIKSRARDFAHLREQCHAGVGWPSTLAGQAMAGACAKFGDTIEARNRLWSRVILGQESEEALYRWIEKTDDLADRAAA